MEVVLEKEDAKEQAKKTTLKKEPTQTKKKDSFTILGYSVWRILAYFVVYSFLGFVIETIFGALTKGVIESRQSMLHGPFCCIYGVGAVVLILGLQYFKKNNYTLFFGGFIIGSIVEYIISWIGEFVFHIKWWDYSNMPFNLNGRICVWFSLFWGALAIYLFTHINPIIDRLLDNLPKKIYHWLIGILITFMLVDTLVTGFGLRMFFVRLTQEKQIETAQTQEYYFDYLQLYENPTMKKVIDTLFSDEKILKTFPNIKIMGKDGQIIWIKDLFPEIQVYHVKLFDPIYAKSATPESQIYE